MLSFKREIFKEYDKLKDSSARELDKRKEEIHSLLPRIKEIEKEIAKSSINISKTILLSNDVDKKKLLTDLEKKINFLQQEKAMILTENNIPLSYIQKHYYCDLCNDSGFKNDTNQLCTCFYQKLIKKSYKLSNLDKVLEAENFSTFDINIFSDKPYDDSKLTPKENMTHLLTIIESFVHNFKPGIDNLLFYGTTGLGKTFLCNCIAKALLDKGEIVVYHSAFKILEILEVNRFNKDVDDKEYYKLQYNLLFESDLLIIDDLGTEMINSFSSSELFNVINSRLNARKSTIISTNLSPIQVQESYSERISSRVFGEYNMLNFYGPDVRWERP